MTSRPTQAATAISRVPRETLAWLAEPDNPAVATLTRRLLLAEDDSPALDQLWARRNEYAPVAAILEAQRDDGSWAPPERDYQKYTGSLWQIVFLGDLYANGDDERVRRAADYAFSRQLDNGAWSANGKPAGVAPCLTANVGRALARMGYECDRRLGLAISWIAEQYQERGYLGCVGADEFTLNGYCHMLAPKILLLLNEVPEDAWPYGARQLRSECLDVLRDKQVYRSLPRQYKEFQAAVWPLPAAQRRAGREEFIAEHSPIEYGDKPGWLRLGFPLTYNSDALEALLALARAGEAWREEYEPAIEAVLASADEQMRWTLKTTFNGRMIADVEVKGAPSKWLTFRALSVLAHFAT